LGWAGDDEADYLTQRQAECAQREAGVQHSIRFNEKDRSAEIV
jgi:hypothetical protein